MRGFEFNNLKDVVNDTRNKAWCGPTAVASITGQPISHVKNTFLYVRYGDALEQMYPKPSIKGTYNREMVAVLRCYGLMARRVPVHDTPTLAAWLERRRSDMFRFHPLIINVTGHYVAVKGWTFCDTATKGKVVEAMEAPGRRARVKQVIVVEGRCTPSIVPRI